jgi:hypothetical protein
LNCPRINYVTLVICISPFFSYLTIFHLGKNYLAFEEIRGRLRKKCIGFKQKFRNDPNQGIIKTNSNFTKFPALTCVSVHPCNKPFSLQFKFHTHQTFPLRAALQVSVKSSVVTPGGKEQQLPPERRQPARHSHLQQEDL